MSQIIVLSEPLEPPEPAPVQKTVAMENKEPVVTKPLEIPAND